MRRRQALQRAAAAAGAVALAGCLQLADPSGSERTETVTESVDARPLGRIDVDNQVGAVTLTGTRGDRVEVRATKRTRRGRAALDRTTFRFDRSGDVLRLVGRVPDDLASREGTRIDLEVDVPATSANAVPVGTVTGDVGRVRLDGVAGDVEVDHRVAEVEATDVDGAVSIDVDVGDVTVEGGRGVSSVRAETGAVDVELPVLADDVTIRTRTGDVTVRIDPSVDCTVRLRSNVGEVTVERLNLAVTGSSRTAVDGRLGEGGSTLDVATDVGAVTLTALRG
jgi:hypothetical protein